MKTSPVESIGSDPMIDQDSRPTPRTIAHVSWFGAGSLLLAMVGCATAPMEQAGTLASYDKLVPANGLLAHSQLWVDKDQVLAAKTVRITPTVFSNASTDDSLSPKERAVVANAIDRAICMGLSDRFQVVPPSQPADLTVHTVVTHVAATNAVAAGASQVASIAPKILLPGVPVPVPRIPIGLGSLSLEAEARDGRNVQQAAMLWGQGANSFTSAPRMSGDGDAYDLAASFGDDFSKMLVTGESPFGKMPSLPSLQHVSSSFGGAPKNAACEVFGRSPGIVGLVADRIGTPPDWTDKGAVPATPAP